jgi:7,8-dihydropterin-6-yl-methyl-4-(beta-D-ribofuranosyl)aminobenzene 5'-phosphate synthase
MNDLKLREADSLEVLVLVDNYTDVLLESTPVAVRAPMHHPRTPLAEHGMACLLRIRGDGHEHHVLFDTGHTPGCITFNMDYMQVDASRIETVVISHGHIDHVGGLEAVLDRIGRNVPLEMHPNVFVDRRLNVKPIGRIVDMPVLDRATLEKEANLVVTEEPHALASGLVLSTNKVERVTDFETGFPYAEIKSDGQWVTDPFLDDQALAVKVKDKGLVIVGGCCHAGIINTVKYCQKLFATSKVHAVMGGFHLNDKIFEPTIGKSIAAMEGIDPDYIIPMHCTGWTAINEFARAFPKAFILNSTCTTYRFSNSRLAWGVAA